MKFLLYLVFGAAFGVVLTKAEIISWFRIYEMFRFESFHMYGVIGSAVVLGVIATWAIKKFKVSAMDGSPIHFSPKEKTWPRYIIGGTIFGLGWAMSGACPGPMYTLLGTGFTVFGVVIAGALLGTFVYGLLRDKLPH